MKFGSISFLCSFLLCLIGCERNSQVSGLQSQPQDGKMKIVKVPLPENMYSFSDDFPAYVPLVTSSRETGSDQNGYWILCHNPAEEERMVKALGFDYKKYQDMKAALDSAIDYNPNQDKRQEEQDRFCRSTVLKDKTLCSLYKLAPELQAPLICPGSLTEIDGGYSLSIYNTGTKFFAEYTNGLATLKAIDIGCREAKDALSTPGNDSIAESLITSDQAPNPASDLNCSKGTIVVETFESLCNAARSGKSEADLFTLNTLTSRLQISPSVACSSLEPQFSDKIKANKKLDLSNGALTSLKILKYIQASSDIEDINISGNPELGAADTGSVGVLDDLKGLVNLQTINASGTQVGNVLGLQKMQFLKKGGINFAWTNIYPQACSTTSVADALRVECEKIQKSIRLVQTGGSTGSVRVIAHPSEFSIPVQASHEHFDFAAAGGIKIVVGSATTCSGVQIKDQTVTLAEMPTAPCVVEIIAIGGRLPQGNLRYEIKPLATCEGKAVNENWSRVLPDRQLNYKCVRVGDKVEAQLQGGTCVSPKAEVDLKTSLCVAIRCDATHAFDSDWEIKTSDGHGSYREQCLPVGGEGVISFKPGSAHCDAAYDFSESDRSCILKRCGNGLVIGKDQLVKTADGLGSYREQCVIQGAAAVVQLVPQSGSCTDGYMFKDLEKRCVEPGFWNLPHNAQGFTGLGSSINKVFYEDGRIYLATTGGVAISADSGKTWKNRTTANGLADNQVYDIYVRGNTIFAGTGGGLSISKDGGNSWSTKAIPGRTFSTVGSIFGRDNEIYISGTPACVSKDGGETWTNLGPPYANEIFATDGTIFLSNNGALLLSSDGGKTWIEIYKVPSGISVSIEGFLVSSGVIYLQTWGDGLMTSTDRGKTWIKKGETNGLSLLGRDIRAEGNKIYVTDSNGLHVSEDKGATWKNIQSSAEHIFAKGGNLFALTSFEPALLISQDGGTHWDRPVLPALGENDVRHISEDNGILYVSQTHALYLSRDAGKTWTRSQPGGVGEGVATQSGTLFAATLNGVAISTDGAKSWSLKTTADGLGDNQSFGVATGAGRVFALTAQGVGVSKDGGQTWKNQKSFYSATEWQRWSSYPGLYDLKFIDNTLYLSTFLGLSISEDFGETWVRRSPKESSNIRATFVAGKKIYAITYDGFFISEDGGSQWSNNKVEGLSLAKNTLEAIFVANGAIYLGTQNGLYISKNNGQTWQHKTTEDGLGSNRINSITAVGTTLYVGTAAGLSVLNPTVVVE